MKNYPDVFKDLNFEATLYEVPGENSLILTTHKIGSTWLSSVLYNNQNHENQFFIDILNGTIITPSLNPSPTHERIINLFYKALNGECKIYILIRNPWNRFLSGFAQDILGQPSFDEKRKEKPIEIFEKVCSLHNLDDTNSNYSEYRDYLVKRGDEFDLKNDDVFFKNRYHTITQRIIEFLFINFVQSGKFVSQHTKPYLSYVIRLIGNDALNYEFIDIDKTPLQEFFKDYPFYKTFKMNLKDVSDEEYHSENFKDHWKREIYLDSKVNFWPTQNKIKTKNYINNYVDSIEDIYNYKESKIENTFIAYYKNELNMYLRIIIKEFKESDYDLI